MQLKNLLKSKRVSNLLTVFLLAWVAWKIAPSALSNFQIEGARIEDFSLRTISGEDFHFSKQSEPLVLVFWATWCAPCQLELNRINSMITEGTISPDSVLAISSFEDDSLVKTVVAQRGYKFPVALDRNGQVARAFQVAGTPTIVLASAAHIIEWKTTGLSPLLETRIKHFLQ